MTCPPSRRDICQNEQQPACQNGPTTMTQVIEKLERVKGIEPSSSAWKAVVSTISIPFFPLHLKSQCLQALLGKRTAMYCRENFTAIRGVTLPRRYPGRSSVMPTKKLTELFVERVKPPRRPRRILRRRFSRAGVARHGQRRQELVHVLSVQRAPTPLHDRCTIRRSSPRKHGARPRSGPRPRARPASTRLLRSERGASRTRPASRHIRCLGPGLSGTVRPEEYRASARSRKPSACWNHKTWQRGTNRPISDISRRDVIDVIDRIARACRSAGQSYARAAPRDCSIGPWKKTACPASPISRHEAANERAGPRSRADR